MPMAPERAHTTGAELQSTVERLEQHRGRLLAQDKRNGANRADLLRELARAEGVGDDASASRIREQLDGLDENGRRTRAALSANQEALDTARRAWTQHVQAHARANERTASAAAVTTVRESAAAALDALRRVEPQLRGAEASVRAAVNAEAERARSEGRLPRANPAIYDELWRQAPGTYATVRFLLALLDGEPLSLPVPSDGYTRRAGGVLARLRD